MLGKGFSALVFGKIVLYLQTEIEIYYIHTLQF